jgi:hypothetical protein
MTNQAWTFTVNYVNNVISITDANGNSADVTIYRGETDTITFQPGTNVSAVTGINITAPNPMPTGVSVTPATRGDNLVVTDVDSLSSTAAEVQVSYCVLFNDARGNPVSSDPKLINKPSQRPS